MTVGQRLLGGGYKLLFQCFSFPLSLAWFGLLAAAVAGVWSRRQRPFTPADFPDLAALLVGGLFTGVFFFRPHKPAYVLIVVPFLIWLATRHRPRICGGLALLTVVSGFVSIDIFRNRMPVSPHWVEGSYRQAIQGKPAARRAYLERLLVLPRADHTVLIGAAWSWDYDFHLTRGTFPLHRVSRISQREAAYAMNTTPDRLLVPRDAIERPGQLARWREKGYTVLVDRQLWRMVFARYRLADTPGDQATVGGVPVHLIDVPDRS